MDVAASEFFSEGKYDLDFKSPPNAARNISADELAGIYQGFINNYPGVHCDLSAFVIFDFCKFLSCFQKLDRLSSLHVRQIWDNYSSFQQNDCTCLFLSVVSIEDPFDQDDWPAWSQFTASVGIQVRLNSHVSFLQHPGH